MPKKQEYFRVKSTSAKTTSFSPEALQVDKKSGMPITVTIAGVLPKANPQMLKPVFSYISRKEKEALVKEKSFWAMEKEGLYKITAIEFESMPDEDQLKYNRKRHLHLLETRRKALEED